MLLDSRAILVTRELEIEKLKLQLARLRRMQFGRSSEKLSGKIEQLELRLEGLEPTGMAPPPSMPSPSKDGFARARPVRRPLPAHLPRETVVHRPYCHCPDCGGALLALGEDVAEVLEYVPARFKVIRHVRPRLACRVCEKIVQAPAPGRPVAKGIAGPGLLAHVLVSKYADHLPLYRQSGIYAREGADLERSTMADWVRQSSTLLTPLVEALRRYVLSGDKLHADDTPVPVLAPGAGKTRTGRLWTYVRDDRPSGSDRAPAVWFAWSADRKGEHPQGHLESFTGVLQADGYAGFDRLYVEGRAREAACWAHVRRKFHDLQVARPSPVATEALARIGALYGIEAEIRGQPPDARRMVRQARARPLLDDLHAWLTETLSRLPVKSDVAGAIRYALNRWDALLCYCNDGLVEIDNNAAERALRAVALGRKNYLFAGSNAGGERAAAMYSLIGTATLNGLDCEAYLRHVLGRIADHPFNRVDELLPWNVVPDSMPGLKEAA